MKKSSQNKGASRRSARLGTDLAESDQDNCVSIFHDVMRLRQTFQAMASRVAAKLDLRSTEMSALDTLGKYGSMTMGELARRSFISPTNTTRTVKNLVDRGLVKRVRSPNSDREVIVSLTNSGRKIFATSYPTMIGGVNDLLGSKLSDSERRKLADLLAKMVG